MKFRILLLLSLSLLLVWNCRTEPKSKSKETKTEFRQRQTTHKEGYVDVKGGKLWYRVLGSGKGTPALMIHGGPGGTHRSFYQFEPMAQERPLILFDQLGSGKSTRHQDTTLLTVENFVGQVRALREALDLKEVFLHGHSWGTALALESYLAHPEGVKGMVFNSPYFSTSIWEADADTLITYLPDSIQAAIAAGEKTGDFNSTAYQNANRVFLENYGRRKPKPSNPWDTVQAPRNNFIYNYMWGPTEFTATGTLKNYDRLESLKQLEIPTLFVTGEFDEARPQTVEGFHEQVKNSEFSVIKGAGHATMHDNREQNMRVIRDFFNRVDQNP
jgi:proline iminopeptidase